MTSFHQKHSLTARIRLLCGFLLLVIKYPVGNVWDRENWLAQTFCRASRPRGSGDGWPGLTSAGKAVPAEGHADGPWPRSSEGRVTPLTERAEVWLGLGEHNTYVLCKHTFCHCFLLREVPDTD